jgi:hypothetical protein
MPVLGGHTSASWRPARDDPIYLSPFSQPPTVAEVRVVGNENPTFCTLYRVGQHKHQSLFGSVTTGPGPTACIPSAGRGAALEATP